jgi:uncharacterized protein (DUF305 family)
MKLLTNLLPTTLRLTRPHPGANPTNGGASLSLRSGVIFGLLALVVVFVLGVGTGAALLSNQAPSEDSMDTGPEMPSESSAEAGFARDMIVHHAQAVQMADLVRGRSQSQDIRILANNILLNQQAEIGQMRGWLQVWGLPATGTEPHMAWMGHPTEDRMPGLASPEEIDALQRASAEDMDVLFLQLMIPHHQAALPMAETVLERTDRPEVEQFATALIASQQEEIWSMQESLQERGFPVESSPAPDNAPSAEEEPHHE